eukprot:gb/GECH01013421.1/.p1 GENE.gb/GECH01013421.1/~~gb/GECH01013421.1/.p1  ORF type:complete len:608 (+),score=158.96 gb/GECH01013421.1/:1-1824(+)
MSNRTVYVGNVAHHVTQEILITFFSVCGQITNIKIAGDPSYPSLFAFIEFSDPNCAATALNLDGQELGGKPIKVSLSRTNINTPFDPTGNNYVPVAHNRSHDPQLTARTVYVSGIDSHQVSEQHLLDFFGSCGNITNYRMCGDPSKASRFAFIEFSTTQESHNAQGLNGTRLGSSTLRISPSKSAIQKSAPKLTTLAPHQRDAVHRTVHIGNVDINLTEDYLRDYFNNVCGLVNKVALAGDTNHSARFAFVEFDHIEAFQEALKLSGAKLGSKSIKVSPSRSPILAGNGSGKDGGGRRGSGAGADGGDAAGYTPYGNYYGGGYYASSWEYNQNGYAGPTAYSAYGYDMGAYPPTHSPPSAYPHAPPQDHPAYPPYPNDDGPPSHPHPQHHRAPPPRRHHHHHRHSSSYHHQHHHDYRERSYHHHDRHRSLSPHEGYHHRHYDEYGSPHSGSDTGSPYRSLSHGTEETDGLEYHENQSEHPQVIQESGVGQKRKRERDEPYDEPDIKKTKLLDNSITDPQQQQHKQQPEDDDEEDQPELEPEEDSHHNIHDLSEPHPLSPQPPTPTSEEYSDHPLPTHQENNDHSSIDAEHHPEKEEEEKETNPQSLE